MTELEGWSGRRYPTEEEWNEYISDPIHLAKPIDAINDSVLDNSGRFFKATISEEDKWIVVIDPKQIFPNWIPGSVATIADAELIEAVFDPKTELLTVFADYNNYKLGDTIILSIFRNTDIDWTDWEKVYVSYTNIDKLLFPSVEKANMYGIYNSDLFDIVQ